MLPDSLDISLSVSHQRMAQRPFLSLPPRCGLTSQRQPPFNHTDAARRQRCVRPAAADDHRGADLCADEAAPPAAIEQPGEAPPISAPALLESDPWAWRKQQLSQIVKFCGEVLWQVNGFSVPYELLSSSSCLRLSHDC